VRLSEDRRLRLTDRVIDGEDRDHFELHDALEDLGEDRGSRTVERTSSPVQTTQIVARALGFRRSLALLTLACAWGCSSKEFTNDPGAGGSAASGGTGGSGTDAMVEGVYTVHVTNRENSCTTVMDWVEGEEARDIPLTITQNGSALHGQVGGGVGLYLVLLLGVAMGDGEVSGNDFTITLYGTKVYTEGNCMMSLNAYLEGTLAGDAISGTVSYRPAISMNPDCEPYDCEAVQAFSGSRPPPAG
jgi:hypothetical protein